MEQPQAPDRNLAMELARVTEAAALAGGRWMGRGDKNAADGAAVDAMRLVLGTVSMDGVVVIGEGDSVTTLDALHIAAINESRVSRRRK